ncbi:HAD-IIB family hydrolase [Rhodococcus hoagii]|nr:HAD-IIB family hydrolase [Prescottella equi]NKS21351.1 HAD-IIB family hydrolase [Prescottella equi]
MTRIRLVASDLDGTLLRSDRTVSPRTARAMAAARDAGIEVVWATARARHSVDALARSCGFRGEAICANGAVTLDLADGTPEITGTVSIEVAEALAAMDRVRTLVPGVVFANVGPTTFVAEPEYAALCDYADHHRTLDEMILEEQLPRVGEPMVKIVARHPEVPSRELYRLAVEAGVDGVELTHSGAPYVEMAATGVSKASALARLCAARGIAVTEVAVIGDAVNDIPMLTWAGTALCPANAIPEVRALAGRVLPSNDDDGVAHYLEELAGREESVENNSGRIPLRRQ